jgi:hypothetical protein
MDVVTIGANSFKSGDFAPNGHAVFDLGSSDARWQRVHTSGLRVCGEEIVADLWMNAGDSRVTNVEAPIADADAATKKYVDHASSPTPRAHSESGDRGASPELTELTERTASRSSASRARRRGAA